MARTLGGVARAELTHLATAPALRRRARAALRADQRTPVALHAVTVVDGLLQWREHPDPAPGAGELVVAVRAAGINNADLHQRLGFYPAPPGSHPDIPGLEFAGEVVAAGPNVHRFGLGDRVMAVVGGGAQAELALVHERHAIPVPDDVGWITAGGFPEAFATAHDALFTQCGLGMGERVCVHGAAGGVGIAGVQLALAAGASVVATVRDPARRDDVAALGAEVCDPSEFVEHGPFDVVLELVGAPNFPANIDALALGGRIAVIGAGAGGDIDVSLFSLMQKRARIHGSTLRMRSLEEKAIVARLVEHHAVPLLASGRVTVPICETFAMAEAEAAYERFEAGGKFGKIVLTT